MSWRIVACSWLLVACGGAPPPEARGPEPIELACEHVSPVVLRVAPETLVLGEVEKSTGFPDLDQIVHGHVLDLHLALPNAGCTSVSVVIGIPYDACDMRKVAD